MKTIFIIFLISHTFLSSAQTQDIQKSDSNVKIYSYTSVEISDKNKTKNEYWLFYKIDWDEKTIQAAQFDLNEGDKAPNLTNVTKLFNDIDFFSVISSKKIKVKRERARRHRAWFDFATPGVKTPSRPARKYYINGDTLTGKNKTLKLVFDKDLTFRYQQEKKKLKI